MMRKQYIIPGAMLILISFTLGLSLVSQVSPAAQTSRKLSSTGTILTIGVGVYTDIQCSSHLTSLEWGTLEPGASQTFTCYIKNEGTAPSTLSMYTSSWSPSAASTYLNLNWDYGGQTLNAGDAIQVTFTLTVSASIQGVTTFSFDITIVGMS